MSKVDRRQFIKSLAVGVATTAVSSNFTLAAPESANSMSLGFGTYGMKTLSTEMAIQVLAEIGFDSIEIIVRHEWDAEPDRMPLDRRKRVRTLLSDFDLSLTALMEHVFPSADSKQSSMSLDRLKRAADLGHALSPDSQPLIQTVLGGGKWEAKKNLFRDQLGEWASVGKNAQTVIAIKPHRGGAMSRPEEAIWLIEQLDKTPWLRIVYDYSHYAFRNMPLDETIRTALPFTAHIAVKDAVMQNDRTVFMLPGQGGKFDYATLLKQFHAGGYRGDINCEVSGMVWSKKGYDPIAAARICYANLDNAFKRAGIRRDRKQTGEFKPLFDNKTLANWEGNAKMFRVENKAIVGGNLKERIPNNEFLCTKNEYEDFELRLQAKLIGEGTNAGIQFRSKRIPNHHEVIGYQCDMGTMRERYIWGSLYDESRRRKFLVEADDKQLKKILKPDDFNDFVIRCQGKRIRIWVNGFQMVDYTEQDAKIPQRGIIGLQIHGGAPAEAHYKDIRIRKLSK